MNNSKIWTIIKHEYLIKVRSRGFIIGTIVAPIGMLLLIAIPALITMFTLNSENENEVILINDKTGLVVNKIIAADTNKYKATTENEETLKNQILEKKISAALIIDENSITNNEAKILIGENTGKIFIDKLRDDVNYEIKNLRLNNAGIDSATINLVNSRVNFQTTKITEKGAVNDNSEIMSILSYFFGLTMYMLMFMYGSQVMQGVVEEKANRIIEVLASSVTPFQIMFGKVVGIGAVGLTQIILWLILGGGVITLAGMFFGASTVTDSMNTGNMLQDPEMTNLLTSINLSNIISVGKIIAFVFYFLTGYFIFATLFAAAGATIDQVQDASSISGPLSILIIIPIMLISSVTLNPEGVLAIVTSLFPFFTPILMVARIITISVPIWQIVLSVILQIATFLLSLKFAAKIYRIGMLKYGKKASIKEIFSWITAKN